tara:strand:+ start:398 stop:817 length:420 start_codon:yes stop_codon:yes gene_type:complete
MITNETYQDIQILQNHDFQNIITFDSNHGMDIDYKYAAVVAIDKEHTAFEGPKANGATWGQDTVNVVPFTIEADATAKTVTMTLPAQATRFFTDTFEGVWDLVEYKEDAPSHYIRQIQGDVVVSAGATRLTDDFTYAVE